MRTVLFCGDQSRYGLAHLDPVLRSFDVAAVVVATPERWREFRLRLLGHCVDDPGTRQMPGERAKRLLRAAVDQFRPTAFAWRMHEWRTPVWRTGDVNAPNSLRKVAALGAELFISAAYPQIFSAALLALPARGAVNFHPSLLPRYRGAHPHFWAIAMGEAESGITAHYMTPDLDTGQIIAQTSFPIADYYYSDLYARIEGETPALVSQVRTFLDDPTSRPKPQDETQATYFRNDRDVHRRIFWTQMSGTQVRNLVRTEQAYCFLGRRRIGIARARLAASNRNLTNGIRVEPGVVVDITRALASVKVLDGCLEIEALRLGKHLVPPKRWVSACHVQVGERLT